MPGLPQTSQNQNGAPVLAFDVSWPGKILSGSLSQLVLKVTDDAQALTQASGDWEPRALPPGSGQESG